MAQQSDNKPIRVVIVDDHPLVSTGIQTLLQVQPDISVIGVIQTGSAALQFVREQQPTVLLLDLHLPDISGIAVATQVRNEQPEIAILVLTADEDDEILQSLLALGVQGYLLKTATGEEVVAAIHTVAQGQNVFPSHIQNPRSEYILSNLTERETSVLLLLLTGHRNREIADTLHVTVKTVEFHLKNIFEKLDVHSRAEAISKVNLGGRILSAELRTRSTDT